MFSVLWLFLIPFIASGVVFGSALLAPATVKRLAFSLSLLPLVLLLMGSTDWLGMDFNHPWLPNLSIQFHLAIDPLSLIFLYLTALIIPFSMLTSQAPIQSAPHVFYGLVLFLQGLLIGFFTARDLVVFTIFWEAMLLPLYLLISLWGGEQRQSAAIKFFVYTFAGSALMIVALLVLYFAASSQGAGTFNLDQLKSLADGLPHAAWLFFIFMLAFAVKTPLFPFHAWLPDAYYEAPMTGTILLSALLSKAGIYGILRIGFELFPTAIHEWSPWLLGLAIIGVFYGGFAAWMQKDFKRLLAYSSFSHVNFVLCGLFIWSQTAHTGAILQAVNHSVTITALFLAAGWLGERIGSTAMGAVSGMAKFLPILCWLTLFFVLSSVALPGLNNFVGELLILFGLFGQNPWASAFLALTVILSVIYMLNWMQHVYFESPSLFQERWSDIRGWELSVALPFIILILWVGLYPSPLIKDYIQPAAENLKTAEEPK